MARVFVVQEVPGRNITPALTYGEVVILAEHDLSPFSAGPTVAEMRRRLEQYQPGDWLLLIGDPTLIGLATAFVAAKTGGYLNILKYDRQSQTYIPLKINMFD